MTSSQIPNNIIFWNKQVCHTQTLCNAEILTANAFHPVRTITCSRKIRQALKRKISGLHAISLSRGSPSVGRQSHDLEAAGSTPAPAILFQSFKRYKRRYNPMFIVRNGRKLELTSRELYEAYCEYSVTIYMKRIAKNLETGYETYPEEFLTADSTIRALAHEASRFTIKYEASPSDAIKQAIDVYMPLLYENKWKPEHEEDEFTDASSETTITPDPDPDTDTTVPFDPDPEHDTTEGV